MTMLVNREGDSIDPRLDASGWPEPSGPSAAHANDGSASPIPVEIRPLGVSDVPRLSRLDVLHALNQPEALAFGDHPLRSAAVSALPTGRARRPAFVATFGDRVVGYAAFRVAVPDGRWVLQALGASVGVYPAEPVWEELLVHAVRQAGLRGARTLYARAPWVTGASESLGGAGWTAYATETVFAANEARPAAGPPLRPRRQGSSDAWGVHQLYGLVAPRAVQQAEALTSRRWELPSGRVRGSGEVCGWVFEDGGSLVAYARTRSSRHGSLLEFLVHPEHREVTGRVIDGTLLALEGSGRGRAWCTVRGYQGELDGPLQERGFLPAFEQEVFVRYTTALVRRGAIETAPFTLDVRERVPRRAPTFLHGLADDGSGG